MYNACYGCKEKQMGCHSTCKTYLQFVEDQKKVYAERRRECENFQFTKEQGKRFRKTRHLNKFRVGKLLK